MEALFNIVVSGFVISLICMAYLVFRSCCMSGKTANENRQQWHHNESSANWLGMVLLPTGVFYVWCSIGIGMHFLPALFVRLSSFALAAGMLIYSERIVKTFGKTATLAISIIVVFTVWSHVASLVF